MPRVLALAPIDSRAWHKGRIVPLPRRPTDCADDEGIEESELHFEVVQRVTGYGDKNAVLMEDGEQYYLARVVE